MYRHTWRIAVMVSLLLATLPASADSLPESGASAQVMGIGLPDAAADRLLGQGVWNSGSPGTSATKMKGPSGIAIAPLGAPNAGRLFVVEYGNHRVLSWPSAGSFVTGQAADLVIGQANFTSGAGATGQNRLWGPEAAVVDSSGRLWVADTENSRVLRFDLPFSNGMNASLVLGQPDYEASYANQGGSIAANTLYFPRGLALDTAGHLYVADDSNHRVLRFSPPFANNMNASLVLGQENFISGNPNRGVVTWQNTLNHPKGIAIDGAGNLYVADYDNNRVLRYASPFSNGMNASGVYGQLDYFAHGDGIGREGLSRPIDVAVTLSGDSLFVTDQWNVRVLGYDNPLSDTRADQVYGQPDFDSATPNNGGISPWSVNENPLGVAVDANGTLFHADQLNHRLLAYDPDVVGSGTPGSCTETALDLALYRGGSIRFNCGPETVTIVITSEKVITTHTTLDGGGRLILNGQSATRHFRVIDTLLLHNIALSWGFSNDNGGAIRNDGTLVLVNSRIAASQSTASGGAIVSTGPLTIINSLLDTNQALNGGALYPRFPGAPTTIINSVLEYNYATDTTYGWGGAILAWDGAPVTIEGGEISNNVAQEGGGIYYFGNSVLTVRNGTWLHNNQARGSGGGIYKYSGTTLLNNITLSGNEADFDGGGIANYSGGATLTDVTLNGNVAHGNGGGLAITSGAVTLSNATLSGNMADFDGGGLYNLYNGTATLTNVTLSGNKAVGNGGGLYNPGTATLTNVTLSSNEASYGGGLYSLNFGTVLLVHVTFSGNTAHFAGGGIYRLSGSGTVTVRNSIVANSTSGGNCFGAVNNAIGNLSNDATCGFDIVPNLVLGPLADNGGPTLTHMPLPGSPAIDYGSNGCPPPDTDQRGGIRPVGSGCDAGAVEYGAILPMLYLPMIRK
jgi:sugar lactone lactonase YvrE